MALTGERLKHTRLIQTARYFEYAVRSTQPGIGFHRARAQPALAGGARARNRFALETLAGEPRG